VSRPRLPIRPAPPSRPRYPRVGAVWGAFAAGTLSGLLSPAIAHADCALPEHRGAVDPGTPGTVKKPGKKPIAAVADDPPPLPGKRVPLPRPEPPRQVGGEPMRVDPPGVMVAPRPLPPPPQPLTDDVPPAVAHPIAPSGGPVHVTPPPLPHPLGGKPIAPQAPRPKRAEPQLDGDVAHVGSVRYIHPHGPDDPCLPPGAGRLVIKLT
jgi:hypothetical protein